jgi:hypothetical protein
MISQNFQDEVWNKLNSIERRLISAGGGGGPPVNAEYVVMSLNAVLTDERRLQAGEGIQLADGGAGGDADLTLDVNGLVEDAAGASGDFFVYYDTVAGDHKKIDWDDLPGIGDAPVGAQYVVIALDATLTDERRIQGGEGIALVDGGAGNDLDVDLDINGLVEDALGGSGDFFVYYDTVAGDHKKIDWDDMPGGGGAGYWTQVGNDIYYDDGGSVVVGTPAPSSKMTEGITIFQGGSDDEILAFQNSDVNHGITTFADTDTYASFKKTHASYGGLKFSTFTEEVFSLQVEAFYTIGNTGKSDGAGNWDAVRFLIGKKSGTGVASPAANENMFCISKRTSATGYTCRWRIDAEGDVYQWGDFYMADQGISVTPSQTIRRRDNNNIWIGINGGAGWTTGDRNYSLGDYALDAVTYGSDNIALGYNALTLNTSGVRNVAIGHDALEANIDSDNNVAIGYEALESHNGAGDYGVIAIGYQAAWADANVPRYSIFIGHSAGGQGTAIGERCIGIGYRALISTTGDDNLAIGYYAGGATIISGNSNVMLGALCAAQLTSGIQNTIVGADCADNLATGNDNVAVGFQAGNGTSTGSQNVWIGSLADGNAVAARTNSIAIGYNVSVDADNKIIIGNASHTVAVINGSLFVPTIKSGANQAGAGAAADELWKTASHATLPDNVVMIGV